MLQRTGRFRRADRLLKTRDFRRVGLEGRRQQLRHFVVLAVEARDEPSDETRPRLGVTVSRRVGNAVVRNRVKRRVREWFRQRRGRLAGVQDLVVIARPSAAGLEMSEIAGNLDQVWERSAGVAGR